MRRVLITVAGLLALAPAAAVARQGYDGGAAQDQGTGNAGATEIVRVYRGTVVSVGQDGKIVADVRTSACPGRGATLGPEGLPDSPADDSSGTSQSHGAPGGGPGQQSGFGQAGYPSNGDSSADSEYSGDTPAPSGDPRQGGGPRDRGRGRPARLVNRRLTFTTDADTTVYRNGDDAAVTDLKAGDAISISIVADRSATETEALASPAWIVSAYSSSASYGFAGKVTGVDTTAGTLTIAVTRTTSGGATVLAGLGTTTVTFSTGTNTAIARNGKKAALGDLVVGDLAAVGIRAGETATPQEVIGTPASTVLALSRSRTTTTSARTYAKRAAKKARK